MAAPRKIERRRANGRKWVRWEIQWVDEHGERQSKTYTTFQEAKEKLAEEEARVAKAKAGYVAPRRTKTLEELAKEWMEDRPAKRKRDNQSHLTNHIIPFLGKYKLHQITPTLLQRFVRHLEVKPTARKGEKNRNEEGEPIRTLKPSSVKNVLITLGKLLKDLEYPVPMPKYVVPEADYEWLRTPEDVARFLDECKPPWFRVAAALAVYAGLRKGEVAALLWDDVDFDQGLIRVTKSYDGPCKNKHVRCAPLGPELATILKRWQLRRAGAALVVTKEGEPITEKTQLSEYARRAAKRAKVRSVNYHQLRHTSASHLAQRVPLPVVGAILGHADPKTTARYAHLDTEALVRDPRLHLRFAAPAGKVLPLRPSLSADGSADAAENAEGPKPEVAEK